MVQHNRTDDDRHKYLNPDNQLKEFDRLSEAIEDAEWLSTDWYNKVAEFNNLFSKYMVG